jgi:hypothetical protein
MKPMECVKTGCHLYSREYQCSFRGDLYSFGEGYVLKAVHRANEPLQDKLHAIASKMHFWQCGDWYIVFVTQMEMFSYNGQDMKLMEEDGLT